MISRLLAALCALSLFVSQAFAQAIPFPGPGKGTYKIGTPVSLGSSGTASGGTTLTLTTTAAIPTGSTACVVVSYAKSSSITVSSVSDGTNSYAQAATIAWSATTFTAMDIWCISNANAVSSSATITATMSTTNTDPGYLVAFYVTNITHSSPFDKSAGTQFALTSSPTSGSTGTLTQANEIAIGMISGYTSPPGAVTVTESSGFTTLTFLNNGSSTRYFINVAYQIVSATTALNYAPTTSVNFVGDALILTLKGF